jgi:hypothetical protein
MAEHAHDYRIVFTQLRDRVGIVEAFMSNPLEYPFWCEGCQKVTHMNPYRAVNEGAAFMLDVASDQIFDSWGSGGRPGPHSNRPPDDYSS